MFFKHDKLYEILAQFYVNSSCDAVWRDSMYESKKVRMYASMYVWMYVSMNVCKYESKIVCKYVCM